MKRILTLTLAAALTLGAVSGAQAVDFKASGEWLMGFAAGDASLVGKEGGRRVDSNDTFGAGQRLRLQLDAVASEALSGTVFFEIGDQLWGNSESGAAMGTDGYMVKVKNAYLDWIVPDTDLHIRMGLQAVAMPEAAGGSAVMDGDVAGIAASYKFNENAGLTLTWMRPFNDNYSSDVNDPDKRVHTNYLDNIDLFALSLPLSFDGVEVTPWVMYGMQGRNARYNIHGWEQSDGDFAQTLGNTYAGLNRVGAFGGTSKSYGSMFWAGLPVKVTALDPWNIEFDVNYGYVEKMGRFNVLNGETGRIARASTAREGWAVKALVEYKMDWGTPGIFGWYASGDDGNVKNGSERLPSLNGNAGFTSFMGTADSDWSGRGNLYEKTLTIDGTWGIGLQLSDLSFVENLSHTFRVAYWGGTNSPSMVKYMRSSRAFDMDGDATSTEGPYLTTNDGLLEFNLTNVWQVYENLSASLELGYIVNMIDKDTWDRSFMNGSFSRQDAWKASLVFAYSF